jgi:hypothetical protein
MPAADGFHAVDLLGRQRTETPVDWPDAEEALETLGIGYLANRYSLRLTDRERRVRVGEVNAGGVALVAGDFGSASADGANLETFELPFPAPEGLRPLDCRQIPPARWSSHVAPDHQHDRTSADE